MPALQRDQESPHRPLLQEIARRAMVERGLEPEYPTAALKQLERIHTAAPTSTSIRDLRDLLWASIDNDDSRDLDQLTVAEALPGGKVKLRVAIADVDALVKKGSPIDEHARFNTTSVYTAAQIFPMLPEKLSTDLTSLNPDQDRLAVVFEMILGRDGTVQKSDVYQACVRNHAKLAYKGVGAWLEGNGPMPERIGAVPGLAENLKLQDEIAQKMKERRHAQGSLQFQTVKGKPVFIGDRVHDLEPETRNRATDIIEDFMIGANGVSARFLESRGFPSLRRIVRTPERWERIVQLADELGYKLPASPDAKALQAFLLERRSADKLRFPDLSLAIIKLMGRGEYVAEYPGEKVPGHFGLALRDYSHSTAPNRRYPDIVTQRLLKAALKGERVPYTREELEEVALQCTEQEDAANKVERHVGKSAAALLLRSRIGEEFDGLVTGASEKGTWVRLLGIPVEGRVIQGTAGLDVGDKVRVRLTSVNVERGYIDFSRVGKSDQVCHHEEWRRFSGPPTQRG